MRYLLRPSTHLLFGFVLTVSSTVFAYTPQSVEALTGDGYYSSSLFPDSTQSSVFLPDSNLDALTRSMLILEANEVELPHVRYHITYSMYQDTERPELTQDYVEITRYNLGPSRRLDLLEYIDAEHVASADEFGVGPHVSWRFVMAPIMGMQANIEEASREEIPDIIAQKAMCFSQPCLNMEEAEMPVKQTTPITLEYPLASTYITHTQSQYGVAQPARVLEELWAALSEQGMDPLPYVKGQPQFTFVISKDVVGQESTALGLGKQHIVLDDAIEKVWVQRHEVAGGEVDFVQGITHRQRK